MLLMTGSHFISHNELRINDSGDNEGNICLVNE